jgi:methylamine dehydrogenase accessory protein MauD
MNGIWLISYLALWVLVIILTIFVLGLVRQLGIIQARLGPEKKNLLVTREGLAVGSAAPDLRGSDVIHQREFKLANLMGRPSMVIFISPRCAPCQELLPHIPELQNTWGKKGAVVLCSHGSAEASLHLARAHQLEIPVIADVEGTIAQAYKVRATPFAYRLDRNGTVRRRGVVNNYTGLAELLDDGTPDELQVELPSTGM